MRGAQQLTQHGFCRQLVILYSDRWYTTYRATLHGNKEVMVQIPHNVSGEQDCRRLELPGHVGCCLDLPLFH